MGLGKKGKSGQLGGADSSGIFASTELGEGVASSQCLMAEELE